MDRHSFPPSRRVFLRVFLALRQWSWWGAGGGGECRWIARRVVANIGRTRVGKVCVCVCVWVWVCVCVFHMAQFIHTCIHVQCCALHMAGASGYMQQSKSRTSDGRFGVDSPRVGESGLWGAEGGWGEAVSPSPRARGAAGSVCGVGTVGGTATNNKASGGVGSGSALATGGVGAVGGGAALALAPGPAGGRKKMVSTLRTRACSMQGSVVLAVSATTVTSQYTAAGAAAAGASGPLIHNGVEGGCPTSLAEVAEVAAAQHKAEVMEGKGGVEGGGGGGVAGVLPGLARAMVASAVPADGGGVMTAAGVMPAGWLASSAPSCEVI